MRIEASAPGKAVICGEYAVLKGAPAISVAVDRRARVSVRTGTGDCHRVAMPGLAAGEWRFVSGTTGIDWLDEPPAGGAALLQAAWQVCGSSRLPPLSWQIDTAEFVDESSARKLGIGSSAAATVALVTALCRLSPAAGDATALAHLVHRQLQGGVGSGIDLATSFSGGVIEYRMQYRMDRQDAPVRRSWPESLGFRFLWSRQAADTARQIGKLDQCNEASFALLKSSASSVASCWAAGHAGKILAALARYTDTLRKFSDDNRLDIFAAGHDVLADLASTGGMVYKPCGAGGGDLGVALATDEAALDAFARQAKERGFLPLRLAPEQTGARILVEDAV